MQPYHQFLDRHNQFLDHYSQFLGIHAQSLDRYAQSLDLEFIFDPVVPSSSLLLLPLSTYNSPKPMMTIIQWNATNRYLTSCDQNKDDV